MAGPAPAQVKTESRGCRSLWSGHVWTCLDMCQSLPMIVMCCFMRAGGGPPLADVDKKILALLGTLGLYLASNGFRSKPLPLARPGGPDVQAAVKSEMAGAPMKIIVKLPKTCASCPSCPPTFAEARHAAKIADKEWLGLVDLMLYAELMRKDRTSCSKMFKVVHFASLILQELVVLSISNGRAQAQSHKELLSAFLPAEVKQTESTGSWAVVLCNSHYEMQSWAAMNHWVPAWKLDALSDEMQQKAWDCLARPCIAHHCSSLLVFSCVLQFA